MEDALPNRLSYQWALPIWQSGQGKTKSVLLYNYVKM